MITDHSLCDLQKLDSEVKLQFAGTSILYSEFLFSKLSLLLFTVFRFIGRVKLKICFPQTTRYRGKYGYA